LTEDSDGVAVQQEYDGNGRLAKVDVNQRPVLQQTWHQNGLLKSADFETHSVIPQYDEYGHVKSVLRAKPSEGNRFNEWEETHFDDSGRVKKIKDCTGGEVAIQYDSSGDVASIMTPHEGKNLGVQVTRNALGQVEHVHSSWGDEKRRYDTGGALAEVVVTNGPAIAKAEYQEGRIASVTQFDGSRQQFDYFTEPGEKGRLKSIQTPTVSLEYDYSPDGILSGVDLGKTCRVDYTHDAEGNLTRLAFRPAAGDANSLPTGGVSPIANMPGSG
jgi:YD repeat-containing protein